MSKFLRRPLISMAATLFSFALHAQTVVSESDIVRQPEGTHPANNWVGYTRVGTLPTALQFIAGPAQPPLGCGSVMLTTVTGAEKVFLFNYDHVGKSLSEIDKVMYASYRIATARPVQKQVASLYVEIDYNGDAPGGKATLVFEPVYNPEQGEVTSGIWQTWTATGSGVWWSTEPINGQCAGATEGCDKTWNEIVANNPDAEIVGGVGINQGSGNDGLISAVDAFTFDETTYNFEPSADSDGDGAVDACDHDDDNDGVPDAHDCAPTDATNDKIVICHNGKDICISKHAVEQHMKHGDMVGGCGNRVMLSNTSGRNTVEGRENEMAAVVRSIIPNPFSNRTTFRFWLAFDSRVVIRVFDVMGREVGTLTDAMRRAGQHTAEFNGTGLQDGVYFYRVIIISGSKLSQSGGALILKR